MLNVALGTSLSVLLILLFTSFRDITERVDQQFKNEADERSRLVAHLVRDALLLSDYREVQITAQHLVKHPQVTGIRVTTEHGQAIIELKPRVASSRSYRTDLALLNESTGSLLGRLELVHSSDILNNLLIEKLIAIAVGIGLASFIVFLLYLWAGKLLMAYVAEIKDKLKDLVRDGHATMPLRWRIKEFDSISRHFNELSKQMRDLREIEKEQAKLLAMAEVNSLVAIAEVTSQVAHDIRSPLTTIQVLSDTLQNISAHEKTLLKMACQRITGIAEELLNYRRSGKNSGVDCGPKPLHLLSVVNELLVEKQVEYKNHPKSVISLHAPKRAYDIVCRADSVRLKRVFSNIINNGLEAMNFVGELIVDIRTEGSFAKISFRDNGSGIPEHLISEVLKRGKSYKKERGTGLGLAQTQEIMRKYGGWLSIESKMNVGTTVTLYIPVWEPSGEASVQYSSLATIGSSSRASAQGSWSEEVKSEDG